MKPCIMTITAQCSNLMSKESVLYTILTSIPLGNRVSFLLHSITKVNKQQLNNSEWGFSCKVTIFCFPDFTHLLKDKTLNANSCIVSFWLLQTPRSDSITLLIPWLNRHPKHVVKACSFWLKKSYDWHYFWQFFFKQITGYTWTADKSLIQLEHIVADLAGVCVRIMISPPVTAHKNLTQVGESLLPLQ